MTMHDATAITIGLAHINAWSTGDWETTRALLAPNVHAVVATTQPMRASADITGIDAYMERKMKAAALIEPGSTTVTASMGDDRNALLLVTMRIGLGPDGAMVTLARAILYLLNEAKKIVEERDVYCLLVP